MRRVEAHRRPLTRILAVAALLALWGASGVADVSPATPPVPTPEERLIGLDTVVAMGLERFNVPGLAIAVVAGNRVVLARGYGFRDLERRLPMTPDTELPIASSSKPFTAFLVSQLAEEGLLDWHAPVRTYLPDFAMDRKATTEKVNLRDMVTHRTGLPRHDAVWLNNTAVTRRELVGRLRYLKTNAALRQRWQYNNLMYVAVGYVLEVVTGKSWEELVRERILRPLGMSQTTFTVEDLQRTEDHALPYRLADEAPQRIPYRDVTVMGPASSLNSTARDMARWLQVNLRRGEFADQQVLDQGAVVEMLGPVIATGVPGPHPEVSPSMYGYGWFLESYRHHLRAHHGGNIDGFTAAVSLLPVDGIGVVVLANLGNTNLPDAVSRIIADRMLGLGSIDWMGLAAETQAQRAEARRGAHMALASRRTAGTRPNHPTSEYVGRYLNPGYGIVEIRQAGEGLEIVYNSMAAPLEHWQYETFIGLPAAEDKFTDILFTFREDADGQVAALTVPFEPAVRSIAFAKQAPAWLGDPASLASLAGTYLLLDERVAVEVRGSSLELTRPGRPALLLRPTLRADFTAQPQAPVVIRFERDAGGRATGLVLFDPEGVYRAGRAPDAAVR